MTAQKTLTRSKFRELNEALQEAVEIKRQEAALKERDEINRAKLLELGESLIDETTATAAPGFQISTSTEVEYDEKAALAYCKRPDVFPAASTMLIVHKDSIGMLIGWAIRFKEALGELSTMPDSEEKQKLMGLFGSVNLSNIFDLNDAGYKAAVRGERFNDIPFISKTEKKTPKITAKSVKLGDELAKEFQIVEDPAPEVEATEPAAD